MTGPTDGGDREPPLHGVRVVEAGTYMSAPFAGLALAHLGADVVKVEPPGGDPFRSFGYRFDGLSAAWVSTNHGKRSVELDLKQPADRVRLDELLAEADVLIHNWRPGVAESLGVGAQRLTAEFPQLIHLSVSGYGQSGPRSHLPVFDGVLQAASGFAAAEARPGQPPAMNRSFIADKTVAGFATQAVLAALFDRTRTGRGAQLSLSMLDTMAYFDFPDLCQDRTYLPPSPTVDLNAGRSAILRTRDGYILASPVSGRQIARALAAVGHPEWKDELRSITSPTELMNAVLDRLESVTSEWTTAECEERFDAHDVPATAVLTMDAHFADPQTVHNAIYTTDTSNGTPIRRVRYPVLFDAAPLPSVPAARRPRPLTHTPTSIRTVHE